MTERTEKREEQNHKNLCETDTDIGGRFHLTKSNTHGMAIILSVTWSPPTITPLFMMIYEHTNIGSRT